MADESKRSSATLSSAPISSCPTANTFHGDVPVRKLSTQGGRGQDGIRAAYIANQSGIDGSDKSGRLLRVMQPWPSSSEKRTMLEYEISQGVNRIADDHDQCQPREEPEFIQSCKGNEAHVSRPRDNFLGGATDEARWMQGVQQLQLLDILRQEQLSVQLDQHREKLREQILLNAIRRRYIEENFLDQKPLPPLKKNSRILAECHRLQTGNKSSLEVCQITNYSDNSAIPDRAGISDLLLHRSLAYSHLAPSIIQRPLSSFSAVATPGYASGARSSLRPYRMAFAQQVSDTAFLGARNGSEENPDNDLSLYSQDEVLAHNGLSSQRSTIVKETTRCKEDRGTPKKVQDSMIGRSSMFSDGDLHQQHDNQLKESICRSTNMRNKIRQKSTPKGRKAKQTAIVPTYKMEAANTATTLGSNVEEFSRPLSHGFTLNSPLLRLIEKYSAGGRKSAPFPLKLHAILATPQYHEILGWLPDGKSWKIFQSALFEKILVPRHFRHAKYASFMRQVNGWSFQRQSHHSPLENNSYFHDLFVRDDPEKCLKMIRTGARKNAAGERVVPTDGRGLHVKKRKLILADGTDTPSTYDVVEIEDVRPIEGKGLSYVKRSMSVENKSSDQNIEGDSCDGCAVYDDGETTMYTFHSAPSPTKAATVDKI